MKVLFEKKITHPVAGEKATQIREGKEGLELWKGFQGKEMYRVKLSAAQI